MQVYTESKDNIKQMQFTGSVKELLQKLSINPVTVIVVKNDELVTLDEKLSNKDNVRILEVVSGG